jgi:type III restriction enzyme
VLFPSAPNRYKPFGTTADVDFTTIRPCHGTQISHINQVVLDTDTWESSAAFHIEAADDVVDRYTRNDHLGLLIPYEFQGVDHTYEPDFLVRLKTGLTVLLEIKGFEDAKTLAKHTAAQRWVSAVNNAREHGRWHFHVCRDPDLLERELRHLARDPAAEPVS